MTNALVDHYHATNLQEGHARNCAWGAGGDCTCRAHDPGSIQGYYDSIGLEDPSGIQGDFNSMSLHDRQMELDDRQHFDAANTAALEAAATPRGQLDTLADALRYLLGGHATLTVVSRRTGTRFTYKISAAREVREGQDPTAVPLFVSVLSGGDNESDYRYMASLFHNDSPDAAPHGRRLRWTAGSKVQDTSPSAVAFKFLWKVLSIAACAREDRNSISEREAKGAAAAWHKMEVWHEGQCCRCGRKLTVPESIASGIGPVCATREGY